jgi:hypothetical protein
MIFGGLASPDASIEAGSTYLRVSGGSLTEKAHVLEVMEDRMGIPHVRFQLQVIRGSARQFVENRTLALETFHARYKKAQ